MANSLTGFQLAQSGVDLSGSSTRSSTSTSSTSTPATSTPTSSTATQIASSPQIFRYPLERILEDHSDYVKITAYKYEPPGTGGLSANNFAIPTSDTNYQSLSTKTILGTLLLPIPQSIPTNSQSASWGEGKLSGVTAAGIGVAQQGIQEGVSGLFTGIQGLIGKATSSAQTGIGQDAIQKFFASAAIQNFVGKEDLFGELLARESGAVINENVELLFRGVNLRGSFDLSFDLAPRDSKEAQEIRNMVLFLKKCMSPRKGTTGGSAGGLFLTAPDVFKIQYMSGKKEHPYLNRYKICALQSLNLNFTASNTYATYADGTPVHMQLDLTFQELTPIYHEDYTSTEEGKSGVGY